MKKNNSWQETLKEIFFPRVCFICEREIKEGILCQLCFEKIVFLTPPLCRMCSLPLKSNSNLCRNCRNKYFFYDQLVSVALYQTPLSSLIHLFKYREYAFLKKFFASLMVSHLKRIGFDFTPYNLIVSVPSHPLRIREKGYNQSQLLAEELSSFLNIPYSKNILICTKYHKTQTQLNYRERILNIEGNFCAQGDLTGKNIILVDDVVTTKATISECSKVLKERGASSITIITLARAQ
ncbi:MAG: hypothetical protein DRP68_04470 [Candidatus Omnitrophota bacterium]|nr:MAG: hypothetical protein DRP68_04470 [Candidatus Omnitrophota bacterium]